MIDLFDLSEKDSLVRKILESEEIIDLKKVELKKVSIPLDYKTIDIKLSGDYAKSLRKNIEPISQIFENEGFSHNIFTMMYEAVLNAYQHGNKKDNSKKISLGYKITKEVAKKRLDIMIEDSGGVIDSSFISFVLTHRQMNVKEKFINWYTFSGKEKYDSLNQGYGTSHMHAYSDEVKYYAAKEGGLIVHCTISIPNSG